jgi:hypothetical protein
MMTTLVGLVLGVGTETAWACPTDVAGATVTLEEARQIRQVAYDKVHDTDWAYKLALGERDQVLAEQADAVEQLKAARQAVRESRRALREVEGQYTAEERDCTTAELDAAKPS